jgi:hypothetical protein
VEAKVLTVVVSERLLRTCRAEEPPIRNVAVAAELRVQPPPAGILTSVQSGVSPRLPFIGIVFGLNCVKLTVFVAK